MASSYPRLSQVSTAVRTTGESTGVLATSTPCISTTSMSSKPRFLRCERSSSTTGPGLWPATRRKSILTKASDGTMVLEPGRSEEHTSELQSRQYLVCRLLLAKKKE